MGSTGSYTYDLNGNLLTDPYKGLTYDAYNVLNRPSKITMAYGATGRYMKYTYDASGQLVRKQKFDNNNLVEYTDYIDGFVYLGGNFNYAPIPEGRLRAIAVSTLKQEFIITDQQGNARVSFEDNGSGQALVTQEVSYYGFGLQLPGSAVATTTVANKKLYNGGAEQQDDFADLPGYQRTFYRNYDAVLGRWTAVDPIPDASESMSVLSYAGNNPIMQNDPIGDLSQSQWNEVLQIANSGYVSQNSYFGPNGNSYDISDAEAFGNLVDNIGLNSSGGNWDKTAAGSFQQAYYNFMNGISAKGQNKTYQLKEVNIRDVSWAVKQQGEKFLNDKFGSLRGKDGFGGLSFTGNEVNENTFFGKLFADWYDAAGKIMAGENISVTATSLSKIAKVARIGTFTGWGIAGLGFVLDIRAVKQGLISPGVFVTNQIMSGVGVFGGLPGGIISGVYFGFGAFYPGGMVLVMISTFGNIIEQIIAQIRHQVLKILKLVLVQSFINYTK